MPRPPFFASFVLREIKAKMSLRKRVFTQWVVKVRESKKGVKNRVDDVQKYSVIAE